MEKLNIVLTLGKFLLIIFNVFKFSRPIRDDVIMTSAAMSQCAMNVGHGRKEFGEKNVR